MQKGQVLIFCLFLVAGLAGPSFAGAQTVYEVGPGKALQRIVDVPWEALQPGDTVRIHWKAEPYREKIFISQSGTAERRISVVGVPGPGGQKPVLEGQDAISRPNHTPAYQPLEAWGLVLLTRRTGQPYGTKIKYIDVEGLELRNAYRDYYFTNSLGQRQQWGGAGVYFIYTEDLTVRNCDIHHNGNGLFSKSYGDEGGQTRNIIIEGNHIYENGNAGSYSLHNSYLEVINVTYQNNWYGPIREGSGGGGLKDRSAGTIIRYNRIDGGARFLDLVEAQDGCSMICNDPNYHTTYVYGNVLINYGSGGMVHYGGDSGDIPSYRKGTLYFYHNTIVARIDQSSAWRTIMLQAETNDETIVARNNIVHVTSRTSGAAPTQFLFISGSNIADDRQRGQLILGKNWLSPGVGFWREDRPIDGTVTGRENIITNPQNVPGFIDAAADDFRLRTGAAVVDQGENLDVAAQYRVVEEYFHPARRRAIGATTGAPDIGAFQFGSLDGAAPGAPAHLRLLGH